MDRSPLTLSPLHPRRPGIYAPLRVDATGRAGPTPEAVRWNGWRRTSSGLYLPAELELIQPEQRIVEAAAVLPEYGGVTGWAALRWLGATWFDGGGGRDAVHLAIGPCNVRAQKGIHPCEEKLAPEDLIVVDGLRITSAVRSACYEMRYAATVRLAVLVLDMAAYHDVVSIEEALAYARLLASWTGVPQLRAALALAEENSWSPMETLMRLVWILDACRPRPLCNVPVFDLAGRHLGTPDLLDPVAGVYGEYDGHVHLVEDRRAPDLDRLELFRSVGLEGAVMVAADHRDPSQFVRRLRGAYRRARHLPEGERRWTLEPPPWWIDTTTVAARRRLTGRDRRLIAHRNRLQGPLAG